MRLTLVPSLLTVLGERSWWIPGWLNRILPNFTIEPPTERRDAPGFVQPEPVTEASGGA